MSVHLKLSLITLSQHLIEQIRKKGQISDQSCQLCCPNSSTTNPSTCSIFMLLNYDIMYTLSDMKQWIIDGAKIYN